MTNNNSSSLVAVDPKIEKTALKNLRARVRQQAEELGLNLDKVHSENMAEPQSV